MVKKRWLVFMGIISVLGMVSRCKKQGSIETSHPKGVETSSTRKRKTEVSTSRSKKEGTLLETKEEHHLF